MPDRSDANLPQVFSGQLGQRRGINIMLAKGIGILLQPETLQPGFDIHFGPAAVLREVIAAIVAVDCEGSKETTTAKGQTRL